jgi:methylglyoxal synthase
MKSIALIAHDNLKNNMVAWSKKNADQLKKFRLFGTGTTGK